MRYLSVCSGIEAATVAWRPLGWEPAGFAEIEAFPSAVLAHHWPHVRNFGDFTTIEASEVGPIGLLVGGTPCQSFSIAGLRAGLRDERGNLALEFLRLAQRTRPRWLLWENVPGVLSSNGGRDFGAILGGMVECGYGFAYRVLDAQYFGVPQRRRRVFVVGYFGDWRPAAAVLFERESLRWNPPPRREAREDTAIAPTVSVGGRGIGDFELGGGLKAFGGNNTQGPLDVATAVNAHGGTGRIDFESETFVTHALTGEGFDAIEDGTGRGLPLVPVAFDCKASGRNGFGVGEVSPTLRAMGHKGSHQNAGGQVAIAIQAGALRENPNSGPDGAGFSENVSFTLEARAEVQAVARLSTVRRLTPRECERLQGFPDDYTLIPNYNPRRTGQYGGNKGVPDGPRYRALGNSMAVPVMRWIGERIALVDGMLPVNMERAVTPNPLYSQGMRRVGCMPCINCGKDEFREIAKRFPEHVARIQEWEAIVSAVSKRGSATFFSACDDPMWRKRGEITHATHGIAERVKWSKTSRGGRQYDLIAALDFGTPCDQWGACEL